MERYRGNILLDEIGERGQKKLLHARVCIVGVGATGCVTAAHLARAGIGNIRIIDGDTVEGANLQRQILYDERDIGGMKAKIAEEKLAYVNSSIAIEGMVENVDGTNIDALCNDADLILDCTDNMETRFVINDFAVKKEKPWIYCGAVGTYGMVMFISPHHTACLRCLFPQIPHEGNTCDTMGILNSIPSMMAAMQSTMALKYLLHGVFEDCLTIYDGWSNSFDKIHVPRNENCLCCGKAVFDFLAGKIEYRKLCGKNAILISGGRKVCFDELRKKLEGKGDISINDFHFIFRIDNYELQIFRSGVTIIHGTDSRKVAEALYKKYVEKR